MGPPEPMLAVLDKEPSFPATSVYERKLDGVRCIARLIGGSARLYSRNGSTITVSYPEIAEALEHLAEQDMTIDGEIVAFDGDRSSFSLLQKRMHVTDPHRARRIGVPVRFYAFDLLEHRGEDLRKRPLLERKRLLEGSLDFKDPVYYSEHHEDGARLFEHACASGWEGIIAKRAESRYVSKRSKDWRKFKCESRQEFVIGGSTEPAGSRTGFGALLLGYYDERGLRYAGKVGTGFDDRTLRSLSERLASLGRERSPFVDPIDENARFVEPSLVCEVAFTEWTGAGRLRHPRYLGLREDKTARDVIRE